MTRLKVIAVAALLAGCFSAFARPLDGIWRSEGWGSVYQIEGASLKGFELTSATCVLGFRAERSAHETVGDEAAFRSGNGDLLYIRPGDREERKQLQWADGLARIALTRVASLPKVCNAPTENTPAGNFDVFARTFSEQYISFDLRHLDWAGVVARQRQLVTPSTTPQQLFKILQAMIAPLGDIHTGIEARSIKRTFDAPLRPGTDRIVGGNIDRFAKAGRRDLEAITDHSYFRARLLSFCRGQWQYGVTDSGIGYLRILQFGAYSRKSGFAANVRALNHALDRILENPQLRALIIDVRLSFGGDDRLGLAIAARLTSREYLAYAIQARSDSDVRDPYTPLQSVFVRPVQEPRFTGPVIELTSPITMSAAETFTQALMGRTPHVTRIGESTQGVFCDSLERHLPNGWTFDLPNAVYRSADGKAFDVSGIPPDLAVPVFADDDIKAHRDPAMAAALRLTAIR